MTVTTAPRPRWWQTLAAAALLTAATLLSYRPALTGDFVWDDDTLLTQSELVKAPDGLYRIWLTTEPLDYWPMTNTSFWLEWRLWGLHSTGYHATNLLLHIGSALLAWGILRRLSIPGAFLAAFLFALHPVNVESVAWIAQRKNTLSMVFFLLSILWYVKAELGPPTSTPRRGWYWCSLAAFVLAMLSKGSVAILPGVLLLLVWWCRGSVTRADFVRAAPFFVVAGALTVLNIWFQMHLMTGPIRHVTLLQRALGAGAVVWFYLYKALLPVGLIFVYPQWEIRGEDIRWWLPAIAAVATTALLVWHRRRPIVRALLCAWLFLCLALLPVMGLTDVYFMTYSLVADHYQYIAVLAVVTCVAAGLSALPMRVVASGALLAVLGTATWQQSRQYADAETLYRATLNRNPTCWLVHNLLGVVLVNRSMDEALAHFRDAVRLKPDLVEAHNNLCHASEQAGRTTDALAECAEALKIDPSLPTAHNDLGAALAALGRSGEARTEFEAALRLKDDYADAHNNLANVLAAAGHEAEAIDHYRQALRVTADFPAARSNLGFALEKQGRIEEAVEQYKEALRMDPSLAGVRAHLEALMKGSGQMEAIARYQEALRLHPDQAGLHVDLGNALEDVGRSADAEAQFREAIRLRPDLADARRQLGDLLQEHGRLEEAAIQYAETLKLDPRSAEAHNNLGVVLVRLGRRGEAIGHFRAAVALQPDYADARNNLDKVLSRKTSKSP